MSIPKAWLCIILLAPSSLTLSALDNITGFSKIIGKSQGTFPFSIEVIFIVLAWFVVGTIIGSIVGLFKKKPTAKVSFVNLKNCYGTNARYNRVTVLFVAISLLYYNGGMFWGENISDNTSFRSTKTGLWWKQSPYWLRGMMVVFILYLPHLFVVFLGENAAFILWPLSIPMFPVIWLVGLPYMLWGMQATLPVFAQQIILLIVALIVGAILGYLYGVVLGKKKSPLVR